MEALRQEQGRGRTETGPKTGVTVGVCGSEIGRVK